MRRSLMLVLVVALAALVFAPAAVAQDDNPSADEIAERLHVELGTVHSHVANIFSSPRRAQKGEW